MSYLRVQCRLITIKFNSDYKTVLYLIKVFKYTRSISPNNLTSKKLMKYEEQKGKEEN